MERKVMGEVFGKQKRLKEEDLKVVLVIDLLSKVTNKLLELVHKQKEKKIKNSDVLSTCYRLFRSIKEILQPFEQELEMKGFLQVENELTSELYKKEKKLVQRETIYQLIQVIKTLTSSLKEKHNIEDAKFIL